jgi:hypothetical protein
VALIRPASRIIFKSAGLFILTWRSNISNKPVLKQSHFPL